MPSPSDPYSRLQYRRLIAWPARIEREWPLLREILRSGPARSVLDLGCGTGEHARFLAEKGFEVVGVDRSEELIEQACQEAGSQEAGGKVRFVAGDLTDLGGMAEGALAGESFGGAVCLGNTLPHIIDREGLERMAAGLRRLLAPGAPLVLQILNYERIFALGERHLPLNFRAQDDGSELVFLRLMETEDNGAVVFCPSTLRFRPASESPVEVVSSRRVRLQGWRCGELDEVFAQAGFGERRAYGGFDGSSYEDRTSRDLLLVVR